MLNYLTVTRPNITFSVSFDKGHEKIIRYLDAECAGSSFDRQSTSGYCNLVGENLVSLKVTNKIARSSADPF